MNAVVLEAFLVLFDQETERYRVELHIQNAVEYTT